MLYEMLAGQPPFTGPTPQAIMARHSLDRVPRLRIVRGAVPDALETVIERALEKVPADRYQTAGQFAEAVGAAATGRVSRVVASTSRPRAWRVPAIAAGVLVLALGGWVAFGRPAGARSASGGLDARRLAVLSFADYSRDSSLGPLADGLSDGLIAELSQVRGLDVVSRNGVAPLQRAGLATDSIARAVHAGTVIAGSVEPVGARVRVNVRLVDGASGADLERASFELPASQLLATRDSALREVARLLRGRLGDEVELRQRRAATSSDAAWLLVQGAETQRRRAEVALSANDGAAAQAALATADSLLGRAEREDAQWPAPVVQRGQLAVIRARAIAAAAERAPVLRAGLEHATRALRLDAASAGALALRGTLRYQLWRADVEPDRATREQLLDSAQADLEAAVRTDPTLASAHATLSSLHYARKDVVSAVLAARAAYDADAYLREAETILDRLFWGNYDIAQFAEARRWCGEGARRFPGNWRFTECQLWMQIAPGTSPDGAAAWQLAGRADSLTPAASRALRSRIHLLLVGGALGKQGLRDSAERVLGRARSDDPRIDPSQELLGYEAVVRAQLGESEAAVRLLQRYVATHPDHSFERGGMLHWWWRDLERHDGFQAVVRATK
jgi:serine/threonine-protein kinase